MDAHLGMLTVDIHPEGRDETIVGLVEHIEKSLMERQSGTEYSGDDHIVFRQRYVYRAQWRSDGLGLILQGLRQLVGHHLADACDIMPEQ